MLKEPVLVQGHTSRENETHVTAPQPCIDPDGIRHPSINAMCRAHGISKSLFDSRRKAGMTLAQCLAAPARHGTKPCVGPDGRDYPSVKAMCKAHGLAVKTYYKRLAAGRSLEEALMTPAGRPPAVSPDGTKHGTLAAMCAALGISKSTVCWRMQNGACREDAVRDTIISAWPGTAVGRYTILRHISYPWFLCRDEAAGEDIMLHAATISRLKLEDKDRKARWQGHA